MNHFNGRLKPETAEEVKEVETIEGMRRAINRYARYNPLVRSCEDVAWYRGLNGEDKMTYMAYHALLRAEQMEDMVLKQLSITAIPRFFAASDTPPEAA